MNDHIEKISDLKKLLSKKIFQKILLISGKKSFYKTGADKIFLDLLKEKNFHLYLKKSYLPEFEELKNIITIKQKIKPDLIIAVGGGCVMDLSKISSVFHETRNLKEKAINSDFSKKIKVLAIPTTAGSGAEVTSNAVIYIKNIKYSVEGELIKPDYFFLIPELVLPSSNKIKSSAGFDAIAQAIESLISRKSDEKSKVFAEKSLKLSLNYFLDYLNKPNYENTSAMCLAANLSGEAISISKTTAPHAVSYPFTALYNVSHGHAVSLTLNKFLKFNYKNLASAKCDFDLNERFKILFDVSKVSNFDAFDQYLIKLRDNAKLENNFEKLGIDINKNYSTIISSVNSQRLANNPVDLNLEDLKKIIQS